VWSKICREQSVVYERENEQIKQARIYFEMPVLLQQLGVQMRAG
jgi:hypothetical protein